MNITLRKLAAFLAALALFPSHPALAEPQAQAADAATPAEPAAPDAAATAKAPAEAANENETSVVTPALWKIADEDTRIYLFGTIHVLPKGIDWFNGEVAKAFAQSDELITEIAEDDPAKMQMLVAQKAMLPADKSLRGLMTAEQKAAYEKALTEFGIAPALFDRFEPWYAAIALSTLPLMQEGFDPQHGVEEQLDVRAKARKMTHTGLETPEYQLGLFDALPQDVQERYLAEVVGQLPTIKTELKGMVEAWKQGDAETLARLMNAQESDPLLVKTLLTDRNAAWAQWITSRLGRPGTVFMAVGAGHLAGPGSVQEQLEAAKIASERVQ